MAQNASARSNCGRREKFHAGGGDEVDHSSVRPFHGSPVVSVSDARRRKLTTNWMMNERMPSRIKQAPNAAISNQICSEVSSKWLSLRVTPIKPSTYNGMN